MSEPNLLFYTGKAVRIDLCVRNIALFFLIKVLEISLDSLFSKNLSINDICIDLSTLEPWISFEPLLKESISKLASVNYSFEAASYIKQNTYHEDTKNNFDDYEAASFADTIDGFVQKQLTDHSSKMHKGLHYLHPEECRGNSFLLLDKVNRYAKEELSLADEMSSVK